MPSYITPMNFYMSAACGFLGLLICLLVPVSGPVYDLQIRNGSIQPLSSIPSERGHCPSAMAFVPDRSPVFQEGLDLERTAEAELRAGACNAEKVERLRKGALFGFAAFGMLLLGRRRSRESAAQETST